MFLLFSSLFYNVACGQKLAKWEEIFLWDLGDKQKYIDYSVSGISPYDTDLKVNQYSPINLFDADFKTCFVCCQAKEISKNALFLKLSKNRSAVLNIFSGYGKNKTLYTENARPKKLKFSVYAAINPEAHVSELGVMYKAIKFPREQIVELPDVFGVKSIPLDFAQDDLSNFLNKISKTYNADFEIPKAENCLILKIEIEEIYFGSKYEDVCISELFFNDRLSSSNLTQEGNKLQEDNNVDINDRDKQLTPNSIIHYKKDTDINFISKLYPNQRYSNKENWDKWFIYSNSEKTFNYYSKDYQIVVWNEVNHPNVDMQIENFNYGGILILNNDEIIYSNNRLFQSIEKIIKYKNEIFIIFLEVIANKGYEENFLKIAKYENNSLTFLHSIMIKDSDIDATGTFHKEANIIYTDINNDNIMDVRIELYDYEIVDFKKTNNKELIKTKDIILE